MKTIWRNTAVIFNFSTKKEFVDKWNKFWYLPLRVCVMCSFLMVFLCLLLSVFSTIQQYEEVAGIILYYTVSVYLFVR